MHKFDDEVAHNSVVVIGAGPAGLTAAYELTKRGIEPIVLEQSRTVGGISRTETYKGYRFDIGGHRFFTKIAPVEALWFEVLEENFVETQRLSRIYYKRKFYRYPLDLWNTFQNLGPLESAIILGSYLYAKVRTPYPQEESLEHWVINKFGRRLYKTFFKTYTEKVWGIPCSKIRADWAAQRIHNMSLKRAVLNALFKAGNARSMIDKFRYPLHGPGMMWERFHERVEEQGGQVHLNTEVVYLDHENGRVIAATVRDSAGEREIRGEQFINSMPITKLIERLRPAPPAEVLVAAQSLSYRDFIVVALILDRPDVFPDNWIYIHSPEVKVGRIQNFKNWSPAMVPDQSKTCLGMEYFCTKGDGLWALSDAELLKLATQELAQIGLAQEEDVIDGTVIRQRMAYPVYDETYQRNLQVIRTYLETLTNLQTVGRAGMHRYNNQDHSMLTAMLAVRNIQGEKHDLWHVNVERSYHEVFTIDENVQATKQRTQSSALETLG